jgi:integrase
VLPSPQEGIVRFEARVNGKARVGVAIKRHRPIVPEGAGSYYAVFQGIKPKTGKWGKVVRPLGDDIDAAYTKFQDIAERVRQGLEPDGPVPRRIKNVEKDPLLAIVPLVPLDSGPTWEELFVAYQTRMRSDKMEGVFSESSEKRYLRSLRTFDVYRRTRGIVYLNSISPQIIEDFRVYRVSQEAKRTWMVDTSVLHVIFEFAIERKMLSANPVMVKKQKAKTAKAKSNSKPFSAEEIAKLRKTAAGSEDELLFFVLLRTGLRASDVLDLRWSEVANGRVIKMPKKTARRTNAVVNIPMQPDLRAAIEAERKKRNPGDNDFVVLNPNTSHPFVQTRLYERCQNLGRRAGVPRVNPHRFRGSFVLDCYLRGCDVGQVAAYLGDTVKTVLKHYDFWTSERAAQADEKLLSGVGLL